MVLFNGATTSNTGLTTLNSPNPSTDPAGTTIIIQYAKAANTTMALTGTARDGWYFYLVNQGQGTCTISFGQASIFGPGLTRGGTTSCSIASGGARYFRCVLFQNNTLNNTFTNGWFTYLL